MSVTDWGAVTSAGWMISLPLLARNFKDCDCFRCDQMCFCSRAYGVGHCVGWLWDQDRYGLKTTAPTSAWTYR